MSSLIFGKWGACQFINPSSNISHALNHSTYWRFWCYYSTVTQMIGWQNNKQTKEMNTETTSGCQWSVGLTLVTGPGMAQALSRRFSKSPVPLLGLQVLSWLMVITETQNSNRLTFLFYHRYLFTCWWFPLPDSQLPDTTASLTL